MATPANTQPTAPLVLAPHLLQTGFSSALDPDAQIKGSCTSSAMLHGGLGVLPSPTQIPEALEWREGGREGGKRGRKEGSGLMV